MYSILKWYALTIGAWKHYKWLKSLTKLQRMDYYLRRVWATKLREQLNQPAILDLEGAKLDARRDENRQIFG